VLAKEKKPMHIITPTTLTGSLWEGELAPLAAQKGIGAGGVNATLGKPAQWADGQLLGERWQPPLGGARYYLVQLAFSLRVNGNTQITSATFCLHLHDPQATSQAIVFDAFPREELAANPRPVKLALSPSLKLDKTEVSVGGVESTIDFGQATPVIRSDGLAEATFCWRYASHPAHPLIGSRQMYAVIEVPPGQATVTATLELWVEAQNRFGPLRLGVPPAEHRKSKFTIGAP
jgi:hypothetical protein